MIGRLVFTPNKPKPLLLAGTQTCFWIQNDLSWQSHPIQQLDDPLDPDHDLLNLVSVRLCWTSEVAHLSCKTASHPAVCLFPVEKWSLLRSAHTIWNWEEAHPRQDCAGVEDRLLHSNGTTLERFLLASIMLSTCSGFLLFIFLRGTVTWQAWG